MRTLILLLLSTFWCFGQTNLLTTNRTFSVTLVWDANTEADLAGYNLYQGNSSGYYTVKTDLGNVTTARITNLLTSKRYYWVVTAYNTSGLESDPSNEVNMGATAPPRIRIQSVLQSSADPVGPWSPMSTNEFFAFDFTNMFYRTEMKAALVLNQQ